MHSTGLLVGVLLAGCATQGSRLESSAGLRTQAVPAFDPGAFGLTVEPGAISEQASILRAQLSGKDVLGLFALSSQYELQRGNRQQDANVFGRQLLTQGLQGQLPLPLTSPISIRLESQLEQRLTEAGVHDDLISNAELRWREEGAELLLRAADQSGDSNTGCSLDASLTQKSSALARSWLAGAQDFGISGRLCHRSVVGASQQQAKIISAQLRWRDDLGSRRLRVSHALVRQQDERAAPSPQALEPSSAGLEIGARNSIELQGWTLRQEVALRSDSAAAAPIGWALRTEISRNVFQVPVTASWQRSDARVWSVALDQPPGYAASVALDLTAPAQTWLLPGMAANLSYYRIQPALRTADLDEQIRLGLSLGW